jgi:hypothetical protein
MPVLSVFVAARAAARWLPDSLQSISRQVLPEGWRLQIRLGIDACEDTLAFAKGLSMPNLETRFFPQHVGPFVIFNSLAQATPSDILVRFDADDVMLEGYLSQQLQVVGDLKTARITHTWSILVDEQLKPTSAELFNGTRAAADGKRGGAHRRAIPHDPACVGQGRRLQALVVSRRQRLPAACPGLWLHAAHPSRISLPAPDTSRLADPVGEDRISLRAAARLRPPVPRGEGAVSEGRAV